MLIELGLTNISNGTSISNRVSLNGSGLQSAIEKIKRNKSPNFIFFIKLWKISSFWVWSSSKAALVWCMRWLKNESPASCNFKMSAKDLGEKVLLLVDNSCSGPPTITYYLQHLHQNNDELEIMFVIQHENCKGGVKNLP